MGGSASLAQIPHELVINGNNNNQLTLNEEVLSQLRRRSQSLGNNNSSSPQVGGVKSRIKSSKHQLPFNVKQLLNKIGVDLPMDGENENRIQRQSTKQLVEHIFDCLGALQHLVKIDQENAPFDDNRSELVSESQSVIDTNRESVGKLLHEMITIYSLCGDTVKILLQASPDAAAVEDNYGRLALHVAVDRDQPWMDAIENLIVAFPQALNMRDSGGRLPLHIAVDRDQPCLEVLRLLLAANPQAAMARRGVGRLPLHYAVFSDSPSLAVVRCLVEANLESTNAVDVYGRNCLHYTVDKTSTNTEVVKYLLSVNPSIAAVRDTHNRLPINIALEREVLNLEVVKLLYLAYPQALQEPGPGDKLPLQYLVDSQCSNLKVIDFIARANSAAIDLVMNSNSSVDMGLPTVRESVNEDTSNTDDQSAEQQSGTRSFGTTNPMQEAANLRIATISRYLLFIRPSIDPQRLRDLNWQARKIAFLLARQADRRPSLIQRLSQRLGRSCSVGNNNNGSPSSSRENSTLISGRTGSGKLNGSEPLQSGGMVPLSPSTSSPAIASKMTIQLFGTAVANALSNSPHNSLSPITQLSPKVNNRSTSNVKESEINSLNLNLKTVGNDITADPSEVQDPSSALTTSREGEDHGSGEVYNIFGSESDRINSIKNAGQLHPAILAQTAIALQPRGANRQVQPRASTAAPQPQVNMYLRLSKLNPDLFRLAVMFL